MDRSRPPAWRIAGLAVALGVPLLLWPPPGGLSPEGWDVSLIMLGAALGCLSEPLPDYIIALLMAAAWGIAALAPPSPSPSTPVRDLAHRTIMAAQRPPEPEED